MKSYNIKVNSINFAPNYNVPMVNSRVATDEMSVECLPKVGEGIKDVLTFGELMTSGLTYKIEGARANKAMSAKAPLQDVKPVTIERPYIMVPGWTTKAEKFDALVGKLTEGGRNGGQAYYVQNGNFFTDKELTQKVDPLPKDAKVFVAVFENAHQSPDVTAPQLSKSLAAIRQQTGAEKVDVEGYSMGGLCTRKYLDTNGAGVGKVMQLGSPNKGSRFADLSKRVIQRDFKLAMSLAGVGPIDLPAFNWLSSKNNSNLEDLNSRFEQQKAKTEDFRIVVADKLPTAHAPFTNGRGDGMVRRDSSLMPNTDHVILKEKTPLQHHGSLPSNSEVYRERAAFFGWKVDA